MKKLIFLLSMLIGSFGLSLMTGCSDDNEFEEAGEEIKDAAEESAEKVKDAVEEAGDEIEDATN